MYCSNFVEDVANKIIDKMKCPCSIKNYNHYDKTICFIYTSAYDAHFKDEVRQLATDMVISSLHDNQCSTAVDILAELDVEIDKNKILSHLDCYNFSDEYYCHTIFRSNNPWKRIKEITCDNEYEYTLM